MKPKYTGPEPTKAELSAAARELGSSGGKATAKNMTAAERKARSEHAAKKRWGG